jgi:hypothetical protein
LPIFSEKNWRFFSKNNVFMNFFQKLAVVSAKKPIFFAKFFGENIFKIKTSVPGGQCYAHFLAVSTTFRQKFLAIFCKLFVTIIFVA